MTHNFIKALIVVGTALFLAMVIGTIVYSATIANPTDVYVISGGI